MPETRKNAKVDDIFNQFLGSLNQTEEEGLIETSNSQIKTLRSEKELFKLLNNGWDLIKIIGDEFIIRKTAAQDPETKLIYALHRNQD